MVNNQPFRIQITQPVMSSDELADYYEYYFKQFYEIGNMVIYFDEVYAVTQSASIVKPYLNAIFTRGREVAKIGVVACVQRPARIPVVFISEDEHYFIFKLNLAADRKKMSEIVGDDVKQHIKDPYGFYYYDHSLDKPVYYSQLNT